MRLGIELHWPKGWFPTPQPWFIQSLRGPTPCSQQYAPSASIAPSGSLGSWPLCTCSALSPRYRKWRPPRLFFWQVTPISICWKWDPLLFGYYVSEHLLGISGLLGPSAILFVSLHKFPTAANTFWSLLCLHSRVSRRTLTLIFDENVCVSYCYSRFVCFSK